jgi:hypothetical protein
MKIDYLGDVRHSWEDTTEINLKEMSHGDVKCLIIIQWTASVIAKYWVKK